MRKSAQRTLDLLNNHFSVDLILSSLMMSVSRLLTWELKFLLGPKYLSTNNIQSIFTLGNVCYNCGLVGQFASVRGFIFQAKQPIAIFGLRAGTPVSLTVDHIVPIAKGGANKYTNLQILCDKCNQDKMDLHPQAHLVQLIEQRRGSGGLILDQHIAFTKRELVQPYEVLCSDPMVQSIPLLNLCKKVV